MPHLPIQIFYEQPQLSSLSNEECIQFLESNGVTIPSQLEDIDVKNLIRTLENNPDKVLVTSWIVLADFYEDVREVVKQYYGITTANNIAVCSDYTLQYSVLAENGWYAGVSRFNCYAYAIGNNYQKPLPGAYSNQEYIHTSSIEDVADLIEDDLRIGFKKSADDSSLSKYNCILRQTTRPLSVGNWDNVIAVRKDTTGDDWGYNDFHVAKLDTDGNWYHKPGSTAILQFIDPPNNDVDWTDEAYENGSYLEPTKTYESNIIYILYKRTHTYTWTGEHYHSGSLHFFEREYDCECGYTETVWESVECSGPPCAMIWSLRDTNSNE